MNIIKKNLIDESEYGNNFLYDEIPINKKGSKIKIKKQNKGKFTDYCGGKVTQECINRGKNSSSATIRKRATFADNVRKWKHQEGGKVNRFQDGGVMSTSQNTLTRNQKIDYLKNTYKTKFIDQPDDLFMADHFNNTLGLYENSSDDLIDYHYQKALREVQNGDAIHYDFPEVVVNAYSPLKLYTYYPLEDRRYAIGHSSLGFEKSDKYIDSTPELQGYNLLTNNCSDDTGKCLERVLGKSMDVIGFTTPGDVKDFALENGGYEKNGVVYIPMNEERLHRFNRYAWEYNKRRGLENMDVKDYPGVVLTEIKINTSTPNKGPIPEPQSSTYVAPNRVKSIK